MSCAYFVYLILFIILQWSNCSLLSRFRYPNEYAAPPESVLLPEDLSDDLYEALLDERPELEPILAPLRKTKVRRPKTLYKSETTTASGEEPSVYHKFEFPRIHHKKHAYDVDEEYSKSRSVPYSEHPEWAGSNTTDSTDVALSSRMLPFIMRNQTQNDTRRIFSWLPDIWIWPPWDTSPIVATCYTCGINKVEVPVGSLCHDLFDSQDWRARTMKRYFRSSCHYNWKWRNKGRTKVVEYYWYDFKYSNDRGLKTARLAHHLAGCYKRFLDIGTVYTSRGCRRWWPDSRGGLTGSRFLRLEHLLRRYTDQCITSPHASLTPFARGISLFARYHVCVCPGRYCNTATVSKTYNVFLLFLSLIFKALFHIMSNLQ